MTPQLDDNPLLFVAFWTVCGRAVAPPPPPPPSQARDLTDM